MMFIVYMWIGWVLRDWYISSCIRKAAESAIGPEHGCIGDTLNHIRCIGIHPMDDIERIIDRLPVDPTTDGTLIPPIIRRFIYRFLTPKIR